MTCLVSWPSPLVIREIPAAAQAFTELNGNEPPSGISLFRHISSPFFFCALHLTQRFHESINVSWLLPGPSTLAPWRTKCLFLHCLKQLVKGGLCQHTAELRAVIADQAYVFDDHVVHLPVSIHLVEAVVEGIFLPGLVDDFCLHLCIVTVLSVLEIADFLPAVGFDLVQISSLEEIGKKPDEFFLFLRRAATPLGTERALRHFRKIKPLIEDLFELLPSLVLFLLRFQLGIVKDRDELVDSLTNLVCRRSCGHPYRLH